MKKLCLMLGLFLSLTSGLAKADLIFSTSNTNALAGSALSLNLGETGTLHTWISNSSVNPAARIIGLGFSVTESDTTVVNAVVGSHSIINGGRWISANAGTLNSNGNLIHNSASAGAPGTGILSSGPADFFLHSSFQVSALAEGITTLSFTPHTNAGNGITYQGITGNQFANTTRGTATITAVPEPSSLLMFIAGGCSALLARRRRA